MTAVEQARTRLAEVKPGYNAVENPVVLPFRNKEKRGGVESEIGLTFMILSGKIEQGKLASAPSGV